MIPNIILKIFFLGAKIVGRIAEKYENSPFLWDFRRNKGLINSQMPRPAKGHFGLVLIVLKKISPDLI